MPMNRLSQEQQTLVEKNLGLVRKIAHQFTNTNLDYEELFQIGSIGLMKAIQKWDVSLGFALSSHACPFIRGEILHYLRDRQGTIRTPRGEKQANLVSLDVKVADSDASFLDLIAVEDSEELNPEQEEVRAALAFVEPSDRDLMSMYYFNRLNKTEIADWLEISSMSVFRKLERAEAQLKAILLENAASNRKSSQISKLPNALPYRDATGLRVPAFKTRCIFCDRIFGRWEIPKRNPPRYCSRQCSAAERHQRSERSHPWSKREMALLESLVGKFPRGLIVRHYQGLAKAQKLPKRSENAITLKLNRTFGSLDPKGDRWSMSGLAKQLGIEPARVKRWSKRGLRYYKVAWGNTGKSVITKAAVQDFARTRPDLLAGIDVEKLAVVLGDRPLAEQCSSMPIRVSRREVQRLDTRQVYPSMAAAKAALGIHHDSIQAEMRRSDGWLKESAVILSGNKGVAQCP